MAHNLLQLVEMLFEVVKMPFVFFGFFVLGVFAWRRCTGCGPI
jgi:hypothetical protein